MITATPYLLGVLGLTAFWLLGRKYKIGWIVATVQVGITIAYSILTKQYGFLPAAIIFIYVNISSYLRWAREEQNAKSQASRYIEGGSIRISSRETETASA